MIAKLERTMKDGTLNKRSIEAMFIAGKKSKELGHIVLLDPVGAGASKLRTETALDIMDKIKPDIIRGNISEIKTLVSGFGTTKGVDADNADIVTEENLDCMIEFAKAFSKKTGAVIATGGGAILRAENVNALKRSGRIYFLDRPLSKLITTDDRPLSSDRKSLEARYAERIDIYRGTADIIIDGDGTVEETAEKVLEELRIVK